MIRCLVTDHRLSLLTVAIANWLRIVDNLPHLLLLFLREVDVPGSPILFQSLGLGCAGDWDHALRGHPSEGNLRSRAALTLGKFLDLRDDGFVLVEVLALELRDCNLLARCSS